MGLIVPCVIVKVAEGRRQTVAAMLQRSAAECPQRILQPLRQSHKALAAEDDLGVLPARESKAEVIQPMIERHAGDADTAIAHAGKIGQTQPTRRVLLPDLLGPVERPPGADATLQCTPDAGAELGMAPPDLVKDGDRPQAGNALEQRYHLAVPHRGQRVTPTPPARRFLLRR